MRLLHVVTLVSPDGAFGGPVRVAENQADALRARGHEVVVAAGERGYDGTPPALLGGTPARLFPVRQVPRTGFSGITSRPLQRWLRGAVPGFDALHIHLGRDLVTLPAALVALRAGVPYVVQPHGMVTESSHPLSGPVDAALTRRVLAGARAVLHLTDTEARSLRAVARRPLPLLALGNGVPLPGDAPPLPALPEVLFCARLQARKRPALFARTAQRLLASGVDASFVLVGPDEGEGAEVAAVVAEVGDPARLRWEGAVAPAAVLDRLRRSSLLVLPSVDEPYPMTVLEALSVGRPALVTDSCGLAPALAELGCGLVVDSAPDSLLAALRQALTDPAALPTMAGRAVPAVRERFGIDAVTDVLERTYASVVRGRPA